MQSIAGTIGDVVSGVLYDKAVSAIIHTSANCFRGGWFNTNAAMGSIRRRVVGSGPSGPEKS
jgi:hypothetical protein